MYFHGELGAIISGGMLHKGGGVCEVVSDILHKSGSAWVARVALESAWPAKVWVCNNRNEYRDRCH